MLWKALQKRLGSMILVKKNKNKNTNSIYIVSEIVAVVAIPPCEHHV